MSADFAPQLEIVGELDFSKQAISALAELLLDLAERDQCAKGDDGHDGEVMLQRSGQEAMT
jgi:hypothetical protein